MMNKAGMILSLFVALTFSCGLPVFAEQEPSQPASAPSDTHMDADKAETPKEATPEGQKTEKKKRVAKKSKKAHKKTGDES